MTKELERLRVAREIHEAHFLDQESECFGQPFSECPSTRCSAAQPTPEEPGLRSAWLYAIEEPNGHWHDGENCVFGDEQSAKDEVELLNDELPESEEGYKLVPLYRAALASPVPSTDGVQRVSPTDVQIAMSEGKGNYRTIANALNRILFSPDVAPRDSRAQIESSERVIFLASALASIASQDHGEIGKYAAKVLKDAAQPSETPAPEESK